jgi:hypothetical protein
MMGIGGFFLKTSSNDYLSNQPVSAGSIALDSTFKTFLFLHLSCLTSVSHFLPFLILLEIIRQSNMALTDSIFTVVGITYGKQIINNV